jgi:cellulose synthase operon protein C
MFKASKKYLLAFCALFLIQLILAPSVPAKSDDEMKRDLEKQLREIETKEGKIKDKAGRDLDKNKPNLASLDEIIARWQTLYDECAKGMKSMRCADALYNLGNFNYEKSRAEYIKKREDYEKAMDDYEKNGGKGPEPINPVPDYTKSLKMYEDLARDYPDFSKVCEAYYQSGNIYLLMGDLDQCKRVYTKILDDYQSCARASMAHFKIADLAYIDHNTTEAIKHLEKVKQNEVDPQIWEMVHYRKAEMYYNLGEFDKAVDLFHSYVEQCDAGVYKKREFREMALEFMAISFSDMSNGAEEAINFFKKIGSRPYESYIIYTVGLKNRSHGQWEDAIKALQTALKRFPFYKDAPLARQALIECFVVKKDYEKANVERESLVDDYGPGSAWYTKNTDPVIRERSRNEVKKAISAIAIYYHAMAMKKKDKALYEKALKRYEAFFAAFPEDKWRIYEFKYNVAEIYSSLGNCEKAAENYEYVAMQDMSKFPEYKAEFDTLGMDENQAEQLKKKANKGPVLISQEDAGYNVIVALDNCRKKAMASKGINEEQAYALPETKQLLEYAEKFQTRFSKSANAADVLYLAANIYYGAKSFDNAIRLFKQISDNYPASKISDKAVRMLANCYSGSGQYDLAMTMYRQLIGKQAAGSPEQLEVMDLAAGAMYKRAEAMEKTDKMAAAEAFKTISNEFPSSKIADRGWFEAGVCYEAMKNYDAAAETFENLTTKFLKSTLREKAFLRAADNFKTANKIEKAAQVYENAALAIPKAEFAIPSLSQASECYQKLNNFELAGKMFEVIYERYKTDPKTPVALYNAGLMFEKAKLYANAITVYTELSKNFPESEYAAEAFFAVGLCYEKLAQFSEMANIFTEYAQKYANDRFKQVQALVKAGNAFFNMGNFTEAEKDYLMAVSVYEKFHKQSDIDVGNVAEAYYKIGDIYYEKFTRIKLEGKNEKEVKDKVAAKTKALEDAAKQFAKAIEIGVEEWTIRATFKIGQGFSDMAEAVSNQTLFGRADEKIGAKVKILSSLDKYYSKAQEYYYKNIGWAHEQNISSPYIDTSIDKFMEMMYRKGDIMEEVGRILKTAPIPSNLDSQEKDAYRELLEEKWLQALDAALPKYREVIMAAKDLGIVQNQWLDKAKARISEIKPGDESLDLQWEQWKPKPKPVAEDNNETNTNDVIGKDGSSSRPLLEIDNADEDTKRVLRRIKNIVDMGIPMDDKIKQLNRIEMETNRNIELEQQKISELKQRLQ